MPREKEKNPRAPATARPDNPVRRTGRNRQPTNTVPGPAGQPDTAFWKGPFIIFLLAFAVRAIGYLELRSSALMTTLLGDAAGYDRWAQRIAAGDWWGSEVFYQAPLYPYFLAVLYAPFGHHVWLVRLVQMLFGAISCGLIFDAGRRLFGPRVGWTAGLLLALYPPAVFFDLLLQKSSLDLLFTCLLVWLVARMVDHPRWTWAALAGACLGGFALTRENALALVPVFLVWTALTGGPRIAQRVGTTAALVLAFAVVVLPVGLRNQQIGGRFLLTTSQMGPNFYIGNNANADGFYQPLRKWRAEMQFEQHDARQLAEEALGRTLSPAEISRYWMTGAWGFIREQPAAWLKLMGRKLLLVWSAHETTDTESIEAYRRHAWTLRALGWFLHFGILAPLAAFGAAATWARRRTVWPLYAIAFTITLSVALFFVFARYRYPLVPVVALFAAAGVVELTARIRAVQWTSLAVPALLIAISAVPVNWPAFAQPNAVAITYTNVAGALLDAGRVDEAIQWFQSALHEKPDLPETHWGFGNALIKQGDHVAAEQHYRRALAVHPDLSEVRAGLAFALAQQGRAKEAAEQYRAALRLDPSNSAWHYFLGLMLVQSGDESAGEAEFRESLRQDPAQGEVFFSLANLCWRQQRWVDAEDAYRAVLRLNENHPGATTNLAALLAQQGRRAEARALFEKSVRLQPQRPENYNNLARLLIDMGEADEARRILKSALHLDPDHAESRQLLAILQKQ